MIIKQILVGPMENFAYIVACEQTKEGLVIDPGWEANKILSLCQKDNIKILYVFNTHHHFDHVTENQAIINQSKAKLIAHEAEAAKISPPPDIKVKDQDKIKLGTFQVEIIHTPGHSLGGICLLIGNNLFTGDTLFIESAGRTDLPGGSSRSLAETLEKLSKMDDDLIIYPGHHYGNMKSASLKAIKKGNPFFTNVA